MAEAHPFGLHYPVDHRAATLAGPQAVPEILVRGDLQRGLFVVVEGTEADEIRAVAFQRYPPAFGQALEGDCLFEPVELLGGILAISGFLLKPAKYLALLILTHYTVPSSTVKDTPEVHSWAPQLFDCFPWNLQNG